MPELLPCRRLVVCWAAIVLGLAVLIVHAATLVAAATPGVPPASATPAHPPDGASSARARRLTPVLPTPPGRWHALAGAAPLGLDRGYLNEAGMVAPGRTGALPAAWTWATEGKVTAVKDQGDCGSCYAFSAVGAVEARVLVSGQPAFDFSENNATRCPFGSSGCLGGGDFEMAANIFTQKGVVLESCDPYTTTGSACDTACLPIKTILDWRQISADAIPPPEVLKQYIYEYGPIVAGMDAGFPEFLDYDGSYTLYHPVAERPNHGVLVVGWDDHAAHAGGQGAWIVKNSWGTGWGAAGYFTIAYGSASLGATSYFIKDWTDYDPTGRLYYYDEAGSTAPIGYGDTEGWGLAVFTATAATHVTRIEFFTDDKSTAVDVYLYGAFNGSQPSNLLRSVAGQIFSEPGYHSVPLTPVAVASGAPIVPVVRFRNTRHGYPIPADMAGRRETGKTFLSHYGVPGSWEDAGIKRSVDVAIRVRTSNLINTHCPDFVAPPVDGAEIYDIAHRWRQDVAATSPYDWDGDGHITLSDIMPIASTWGQTTCRD